MRPSRPPAETSPSRGRPEMPYTVHDSRAARARIEDDLGVIVSEVREADPALRSLVLTGGFARGEGAMLDGQPQNDYDLVAIRGLGRPVAYDSLVDPLEERLGIHVDLAPVPAWRLSWVPASIFWYETALRGHVLWGEDPLDRIPVRSRQDLDPAEGLRLLVNRAAGLLLARDQEAHERRLQAAKALLAALDAHLLAGDAFAPSQRERWAHYQALSERGKAPSPVERGGAWLAWAYRFKVDPGSAARPAPDQVSQVAADAILEAIPVALDHAGLSSVAAYGRQDGVVDHAHYLLRSSDVPGGRRLVRNPTGRVRVATLRLLDAFREGRLDQRAPSLLSQLADGEAPLEALEALRAATLQ